MRSFASHERYRVRLFICQFRKHALLTRCVDHFDGSGVPDAPYLESSLDATTTEHRNSLIFSDFQAFDR